MGTTVAVADGERTGLLEMWHLLSLDAPTVAAVWTWFVARCAGVRLPWVVPAAMFLAVWMLYAADRLLDARGAHEALELRHLFHQTYRRRFGVALGAAGIVLLWLVMSIGALPVNALRYFAGLGVGLAAWLAAIHAGGRGRTMAKELATGAFFAAAVFLPAMARVRVTGSTIGAAVCFGGLCWVNCLFIYRWEHGREDEAHAITRAGVRWVEELAGILALGAGAGAMVMGGMRPVMIAVSLAAAAMLALHRLRLRLERTRLRAAVDLALLTPLLVGAFLR